MLMDRESALGRSPPLLCELEKPLLISRSAVSVTNTMTRNFSSPRMIVRKDARTHNLCFSPFVVATMSTAAPGLPVASEASAIH